MTYLEGLFQRGGRKLRRQNEGFDIRLCAVFDFYEMGIFDSIPFFCFFSLRFSFEVF
jgi:hypothetical protein